ncbi:dTDP-4-dehydrorhamnose 3,5-epimerase family protein [Clostridium estertheticum]
MYHPEFEGAIAWNDLDINIKWPLDGIDEVLLSDKDKLAKTLKECKIKI